MRACCFFLASWLITAQLDITSVTNTINYGELFYGFFNCRSFSSGRNSRRQTLQQEEMNANPNLRTKLKIRIRRIVMLWLPSTLSEFCVISSIISGIASIWKRISCGDTIKTTWKPQAHNDIRQWLFVHDWTHTYTGYLSGTTKLKLFEK